MNLRCFQSDTVRRGVLRALGALAGVLALAAATTTVPEAPKANPHHADPWVLPVGEPALPEGDLAAPVRRHCALCHSFDYIATQPRLSRAGWTASVEKMRAKYGAPIPTNDVPALVNFLVKHHGKE
jgi:hypothetical protein